MPKYKVVAYRADTGGCEKARLKDPIKYILKNHSNTFDIEIKSSINRSDYLLLEDEKNPLSKILGKKADLLIFQRSSEIKLMDFILDAKKYGVKTIYELDDDFSTIPPTSSAYTFYIKTPNILSNINKLMKTCDAVTVSTKTLQDKYKTKYLLPNSLDFDDFSNIIKKNINDKIIIGWMGSATHLEDIQQIASAVTQVVNKYKNVYFALGGWNLRKHMLVEENPIGCFPVEKEYNNKVYPSIKNYNILKPLYNKYIKKEDNKYYLLNMEIDNDILRKEFPSINLDEFIMIRKRSQLKGTQYIEVDERHLFDKIDESKIIEIPWVSNADELAKVFKDFDIGLAPLHDNEFNCSKCLVGDTKLFTTKGVKLLKDIKVGDKIWQEKSFEKVSNIYKYSNRETLKIITRRGYELEGTLNHKIRVKGEFKRLDSLVVGDRVDIGLGKLKENIYQKITNFFKSFGNYSTIDNTTILNLPKPIIKKVILKLIETTGQVTKSGYSFTSINKCLIKNLQFLLLGFGIFSKIQSKYPSIYSLHLGIRGSAIFYKKINDIFKKKQIMPSAIKQLKKIITDKYLTTYKEDDFFDEIISIEPGSNDVFDLEIPNNNYYLANGIISHNSNIKFLQYSALAIPTIASRVGPYEEIEKEQVGITIKSKGAVHDKWVKALELLINNEELRTNLGNKAYKYVKEKYDMNNNSKLWVDTWLEVLNDTGK